MNDVIKSNLIIDSVFSLTEDFCFLCDEDANILKVNKPVISTLGYKESELEGMNVINLHPEHLKAEALRVISDMLNNQLEICTIPLITKNKVIIPVRTKVKIINIGEKKYILGISKDLSELNSIKDRFKSVFDNNPVIMAISDIETGVYLSINKAFTSLLGYKEYEVIGKSSTELFDVFTPEIRRQLFLDFEIKGKIENLKVNLRTKSGTKITGLLSGDIIVENNHKLLITSLQDITLQEKLLYDIKNNESRWNAALEGSGAGVWDWNLITNELYFSNQWKKMLGYEVDEINNSLSTWENLVHPDDINSAFNDISRHLRGEIPYYKNIHRLKHKSGKYLWILDSGKISEYLDDGTPSRFIGTHKDITEEKEREIELSIQKDWIKNIIDSAMAGIMIIDIDEKNIVDANEAVCTILKCSREELVGSFCFNYDLNPYISSSIIQFENSEIINKEVQLFTFTSEKITVLKSVKPKIIGGKRYLIESFIDITELKEIEKKIKENEEILELFFNQSLSGFFIMMIDEPVEWNDSVNKNEVLDYVFSHQRNTRVNQALLDQYNYDHETFFNMVPKDFYTFDIEYGKSLWRDFFDKGKLHIQTKEKKSDGTDMYIEGDYICLYDEFGRIRGHFGIQNEVTDKVLADMLLAEKNEEIERYFNITIDYFLITDQNANFIRVNKQWETLLGKSIKELNNYQFMDFVHPEDVQSTIEVMSQLEHNVHIRGFVNRYRNYKGEYVYLEWNSIKYDNRIYAAARDITQRIIDKNEILELLDQTREANELIETNLYQKNILIEELENIRKKLEDANREKERLMAIIAHDLRSPMSGFIGLTKMMSENTYEFSINELRDLSRKMGDAASTIYELLENLLDWTTIKRGGVIFVPENFNICNAINDTIYLLKTTLINKKITIENNLNENESFVYADEVMIKTVFRNLLTNAIKFSKPESKIIIDAVKTQNDIVITIQDFGVGIPAEMIPKLFIIGEKVTRTGTSGEKSTGLGLVLCKEYIDKNNGSINIESTVNKGTRVYVSLPVEN